MADQIEDGGPAFPNWDVGPVGADGVDGTVPVPGMSLRDHFAGQALAGLLAEASHPQSAGVWDRAMDCAAKAYEFADAMLKARR